MEPKQITEEHIGWKYWEVKFKDLPEEIQEIIDDNIEFLMLPENNHLGVRFLKIIR